MFDLATLGTGLGGVVYAILIEHLLANLGYNWTVRIVGIYSMVLLLFISFLIRQRRSNSMTMKFELSYLRDYRIWLFFGQSILGSMAFQCPIIYMSQYAGVLGLSEEQYVHQKLVLYLRLAY